MATEIPLNPLGAMRREEFVTVLIMAQAGLVDFAREVDEGVERSLRLREHMKREGIEPRDLIEKCQAMVEALRDIERAEQEQDELQ